MSTPVAVPVRSGWSRFFAFFLLALCAQAYAEQTPVLVNINTADAATLADALQGVGLARAEAIVEYRETHGAFQDAYELTAIKGVGERTVMLNEGRIRLRD
ncbi:MAG: helix-hairpin-helix domain-containing protein [Pseudomonadota bacterium]